MELATLMTDNGVFIPFHGWNRRISTGIDFFHQRYTRYHTELLTNLGIPDADNEIVNLQQHCHGLESRFNMRWNHLSYVVWKNARINWRNPEVRSFHHFIEGVNETLSKRRMVSNDIYTGSQTSPGPRANANPLGKFALKQTLQNLRDTMAAPDPSILFAGGGFVEFRNESDYDMIIRGVPEDSWWGGSEKIREFSPNDVFTKFSPERYGILDAICRTMLVREDPEMMIYDKTGARTKAKKRRQYNYRTELTSLTVRIFYNFPQS